MEKSVLDNANPTILNVSQLPSRRQKQTVVRRGPESKYDDILFPRQAGPWGSARNVSSWPSDSEDDDELNEEPIDEQEIYDLISTISDPEHPHTLGQLSVVNLPDIHITRPGRTDPSSLATVLVEITPTITHCSLATVIGLAVRVRLEQALPPNYRVDIRMKEGAHAQDDQVNKQLADKERVAAALENDTLKNVLDKMLLTCA
ncbi:hypothetical protein QBC33DRAFT_188047 [Phialemonium atrogriseum]|uniref:MIP18 family-like domain-containing protein n=1 Tax=Phialemonium atrogriseum TaxID=1093897 RepID=A0AAJ0FIZ4_9PEZI|nr:uncharacterized protein QBC33DRAFT_188047 [Phialemonium atrogriseum]KAK1764893.1 hypothetical protein QBC33DRAFT_188047 [Phialemonium atrogriseum]